MALPAMRKALANVTVADSDTLECGVCYHPLRPPVFQCAVGHSICMQCRDKVAATGRCHVCRVPIIGGHQRNNAMEKLLESIRMPCANAGHGCTAMLAYYDDLGDHLRTCSHKPCFCPAGPCGFVGSTAALLAHFAAAHGWPCTTQTHTWKSVKVHLRDGFNAVSVRASGKQHLFLLNVVSLKYSRNDNAHGGICRGHNQETKFKVATTDLSGGPPNSPESFQFFLPKCVHPDFIHTITASFDVVDVTIDLS